MGETLSPRAKVDRRNLLPLGLIIVFGIFASTLPQPLVLGRLPLQFLLKNDVHVTIEQMAAFFFWCTLAWYLKPFAGIQARPYSDPVIHCSSDGSRGHSVLSFLFNLDPGASRMLR